MRNTLSTHYRSLAAQVRRTAGRLTQLTVPASLRKPARVIHALQRAHTSLTDHLLRAMMLVFAARFPAGLTGIAFDLERVEDGRETIVTPCSPRLTFRLPRGGEFDLPLAAGEYDWDSLDGDALAVLYGGSVADVDDHVIESCLHERLPSAESVYRFAEEVHHLCGRTEYRLTRSRNTNQ